MSDDKYPRVWWNENAWVWEPGDEYNSDDIVRKVVPVDALVIERDELGKPLLEGRRLLGAARAYRGGLARRGIELPSGHDLSSHFDALTEAISAYLGVPVKTVRRLEAASKEEQ